VSNLLKTIFQNNQKALIPYFTLGDPNLDFTYDLVKASFEAGAAAIELGIPFSDPLADGPVIQTSHFRALTNQPNLNLDDALAFLKKIKKEFNKPIIFMCASNLIYHFGIEKFFALAQKNQLDAIVIPDLPYEENAPFYNLSTKYQVPLIFLISPLADKNRIKLIAQKAHGFIYLISSLGTTGERMSFAKNLQGITLEIKKNKDIPVVVGFGISKKEHLKEIFQFADGGIIGSYFVRLIAENLDNLDLAKEKICEDITIFTQ